MKSWFEKHENLYKSKGKEKADCLMKDFLSFIMKKYPGDIIRLKSYLSSHKNEEPLLFVLRNIVSQKETYQNAFYEIAGQLQYLPKTDIIECISDLASSQRDEKVFEEKVRLWKKNKNIKDILYEKGKPMIMVCTPFGDFPFADVRLKFDEEVEAIQEIHKMKSQFARELLEPTLGARRDLRNTENGFTHLSNLTINNASFPNTGYNAYEEGNLDYQCHFATDQLSVLHPDLTYVTAQLPNCFSGSYWLHSYAIDEESKMVIDIANSILMPVECYDVLFEPEVLVKVKGYDKQKLFKSYEEDSNFSSVPSLEEIAAYKKIMRSMTKKELKKLRKQKGQ